MSNQEKRIYQMDTDTLSALQLSRSGCLDPQEHQAFIELMERSGLDEHKRRDIISRLIDCLKGI